MRKKNVFGKSAVILAALFAGAVLSGCTDGDSDKSENAAGAASSVYSGSGGSYSSVSLSAAVSSTQSSSSQSAAESGTQSSSSQSAAESGTQSSSSQSAAESSTQSSSSQPEPVVTDPASYITEDEAREAALKEENVREYQVEFTRSELVYDNGTAVYCIEFAANTLLYQYKVNALDGSVKLNGIDFIPNAAKTPKSVLISEEAAKKVALKQHKYSESEVDFIEVELYYDGAKAMYSVDLNVDGIIWGTDLDAVTGSVISISQAIL